MRALYCALLIPMLFAACHSPTRTIQPILNNRHTDTYAAMKTAPFIALAEIVESKPIGGVRDVETRPLQLFAITAGVPLVLRGSLPETITFHSWLFAGGKHGGPRLFHAGDGSLHILFLKRDGPYLHTVGNYPAHDLELHRSWAPRLVQSWKERATNYPNIFERLAHALIEAELQDDSSPRLSHYSPLDFDLQGITSRAFVQSTFESHCASDTIPAARAAACATARWAQGPR